MIYEIFWSKDSASREQYKINLFIFIAKAQPIFDFRSE